MSTALLNEGRLNSTMRAAVWTAPDTIEPRQLPLPEIPAGWALVRTEMTGLCGSDFSILHGTHPRAEAPLVMGHEITGIEHNDMFSRSETAIRNDRNRATQHVFDRQRDVRRGDELKAKMRRSGERIRVARRRK